MACGGPSHDWRCQRSSVGQQAPLPPARRAHCLALSLSHPSLCSCIVLRREKLDLLRQQRVLEEAIDPEGTALTRMAAEQARRAEAEEVRREALRAAVAFWALMGLLTLAHEHLPAISGAGMVVDGMVL